MSQTQEQKDIIEIREDLKSIRKHLDNIKAREDDSQIMRLEQNRKLDLLVNALTDNDYNGNSGYLTRLNKIETMVVKQNLYWNIFFAIIVGSGILTAILKYFTK
jgi:hypothetical protein